MDNRKKGTLYKKDNNWYIHSEDQIYALHPTDTSQLEIDSNSDIMIGKEIEFELIGLYAKYCIPKHMEINLL